LRRGTDGLVKSLFRLLNDHFGTLQAGTLNFKNSSQAPQTAKNFQRTPARSAFSRNDRTSPVKQPLDQKEIFAAVEKNPLDTAADMVFEASFEP
jgi:hypothetical protein